MPEEKFMTLPRRMDNAHNGYSEYLTFPPLRQAHTLNGSDLTILHHSMREGNPRRASHQLGSAWAQIELAHVRDFEDSSAEAQELLALSKSQALTCEELVESDYQEHPNYFDRLYRARMLGVYTEHFAQLGPVNWPEKPTNFQRSAYVDIQESLVEPVLDDLFSYAYPKNRLERLYLADIKGILGELVVLQTLNRIQGMQEQNEWSIAPASMRENCRSTKDRTPDILSSAFDLKCTFADQTFVPIEVKWKSRRKAKLYNPAIAFVCTNDSKLDAIGTVRAMSRETGGQRLSALDTYNIQTMHDAVLESISNVTAIGESISTRRKIA